MGGLNTNNLFSSSPMVESNQLFFVKCIKNKERNSWKYHYGNTICIEIRIAKAIHDEPTTRNGYFIKIIKKYQYTNCTNCTNGANINDFNKVIT